MDTDERRHIVKTVGGGWILFANPAQDPEWVTPQIGDLVHHNISALDYQDDLRARGLCAIGYDWWVREIGEVAK